MASLAPGVSVAPLQPGEPAINRFLRKMIKLGASDLHLSAEVAPMVRLHGAMKRLEERAFMTHDELHKMLIEIMPERNRKEFEEIHDTDFAHSIEDVARFRVNAFMDRKGAGTVIRQIPFEILSPEKLGIPKQVLDLCWLSKGLVLVTGPTGSGKSTTLATLIDYINQNREDHIITIEDPIEFVHPNKKCLVNQREIVTHTNSFKRALRAALREDPDIVLVGEMRDLETISIAIETAETGHLVFGTLHTTTAAGTVDRIIDQFPPEQQAQIRVMLSESLRGVIAQMLCKKEGGGRVATYEILITTSAISNLIREGKTFQIPSAMQTGRKLGMRLMNDHLLELVLAKEVAAEEAYIKSNDKHGFKLLLSQNNVPLKLAGKEL
ncbi:MAG: type IV pilus twitching motility protein PilT [Myxococcales bacterium]|nr:MAG: type IV pilus twitching motility protein PilT [Myxococcales bacterium]